MKQQVSYFPQGGVCSQVMNVEVENDIVTNVEIIGGCPGNTIGVSRLIIGMQVDEAIHRLEGIDCRGKGTSCPDQLAQALKQFKSN